MDRIASHHPGHLGRLGTGGAPLHYNPHRHLMPNPMTRRQKIIIGTTTGVALVTVLAIVFWPGSASAAGPVVAPSPTPAPPPAPTPGPQTGATKSQWMERQRKLRTLGYSEVGDIDGEPGPNTESAIRLFQRDWNKFSTWYRAGVSPGVNVPPVFSPIAVDGRWGPQTEGRANHALGSFSEPTFFDPAGREVIHFRDMVAAVG